MELERRTYTKSVKSVDLCGSESFPCAAYKSAIVRIRLGGCDVSETVARGVTARDGRDVEKEAKGKEQDGVMPALIA